MGKIYKNGIEYGGGGGDSAGHIILDNDGIAMAEEPNLQFKGLNVTDNSTDEVTEVESAGLNQDSMDDVLNASIPGNQVASNGLVYSTEEQVVGKWIDGKPLYQKTIIADIPTAQEEGTDVTSTVIASQNVDTFCHHISQILIDRVTGEVIYFGEYANTGDSSYRNFTYRKTSSNALEVTFHNKFVPWYGKMIVTVQYTKTTD